MCLELRQGECTPVASSPSRGASDESTFIQDEEFGAVRSPIPVAASGY